MSPAQRCPKIKKRGLGHLSKQGTDSENTICSVRITNLPITSIKCPRSYIPAQTIPKYQGHCLLSSLHRTSSLQSKYRAQRKKKLVKTYHRTVTKTSCMSVLTVAERRTGLRKNKDTVVLATFFIQLQQSHVHPLHEPIFRPDDEGVSTGTKYQTACTRPDRETMVNPHYPQWFA